MVTTQPPEPTALTQELVKKDEEHLFHPFAGTEDNAKIICERGKGAIFWDTNGKQYIDLSSGGAQFCHLGFGRKEIADAVYEQMLKMSHVFLAPPLSTIPAIEYATELAKVLPGDLSRVFFVSSGTEATEAAVKIARFYWHQRVQAGKYKVISLSGAYHGASHFAGSTSGLPIVRASFGIEFPGIVRAPSYHCYLCPFKLKYPSCGIACAQYIERIIETEGAESIACMIAEPVQGFGGVIWPPDEYWPIVTRILRENDILLICDEVQTGFCRTGKFWGVNNWNFVPDILTMGKGINSAYIALGAVGISDKLYQAIAGKVCIIGGTASGNAAAIASGRAALKILTEEKLGERSGKLGEHIHKCLVSEFLPLPCVDDVMGRGCYQSFELALNKTTGSRVDHAVQEKISKEVFWKLADMGVYTRIVHGRRVYITPPLIIGEGELDTALNIMLSVMKEVRPV